MLTHERAAALRAELRELQSKSGYTVDDLARIDEIGQAIASEISERSRKAAIDDLGTPPDLGGGGFAAAIRSAGFTGPRGKNTVEVEFKTASFDGDPLDFSPRRFGGAPLGFDSRWLHPIFPQVDVAAGDTGVQTFRQKSRTLADPGLMVRAIDATSTKPETDTTTEVITAELKQVANVSTGTPNAADLWGLRRVAVKSLWAPLVLDPRAAGVLYRSPIRFGAFEENAGQTNTSTVRLEAHALFVVQRPDAIAEIPVFS